MLTYKKDVTSVIRDAYLLLTLMYYQIKTYINVEFKLVHKHVSHCLNNYQSDVRVLGISFWISLGTSITKKYIKISVVSEYNLNKYITITVFSKYNLNKYTKITVLSKYNLNKYIKITVFSKYNLIKYINVTGVSKK